MKNTRIQTLTLVTMILAAAFSRIVPHMPNFSPMDAITLFAAAYFVRTWQVFFIPFAAMWLSSLFIDNVIYAANNPHFVWMYPGFHWQYFSYFLIGLLGLRVFRRGATVAKIAASSVGAGAIFFAISNFGVWLQDGLYPHNFAGLIACYTAALPFYQGTLAGDAVYTLLLFGGFAFFQKRFPVLQQATITH